MATVDNKQAPEIPIKRPKPIQLKKLKNGKTKIQKYIDKRIFITYFKISNKLKNSINVKQKNISNNGFEPLTFFL